MRTPRFLPILLAVLAGCSSLFAAGFRLAAPISDHMVLQREKPVAVWGWADAGESVTVAFAGQSKSATANADGKWILKLDALKASAEPRTLVVSGKDGHKVEVKDVLVGEVWLGSGQSNMAMNVQSSNNFDAEKAVAQYPLIRHYQESSGPSELPLPEGKGVWKACTPDNVGSFSAVLYFFGREIHKEVGVPVGLVNTSVGGTPIESWVSAETQSSDPETKAIYDMQQKAYQAFDATKATALFEKQLAALQEQGQTKAGLTEGEVEALYKVNRERTEQIHKLRDQIAATDIGSYRFVARAFDAEATDVVKWLMLALVAVFDPLAVTLVVAFNMALTRGRAGVAVTGGTGAAPADGAQTKLLREVRKELKAILEEMK